MASVVADTHTVVWYLAASPRLSARAKTAIDAAITSGQPVWVPTICLVEIAYLVEKTRLPEAAWESLLQHLNGPHTGFRAASFSVAMAEALRRIPVATVPDMPDRMIAATALALSLPLVTCDPKIQAAPLTTIW